MSPFVAAAISAVSSVARAIDCSSIGRWFKSDTALVSLTLLLRLEMGTTRIVLLGRREAFSLLTNNEC